MQLVFISTLELGKNFNLTDSRHMASGALHAFVENCVVAMSCF